MLCVRMLEASCIELLGKGVRGSIHEGSFSSESKIMRIIIYVNSLYSQYNESCNKV